MAEAYEVLSDSKGQGQGTPISRPIVLLPKAMLPPPVSSVPFPTWHLSAPPTSLWGLGDFFLLQFK